MPAWDVNCRPKAPYRCSRPTWCCLSYCNPQEQQVHYVPHVKKKTLRSSAKVEKLLEFQTRTPILDPSSPIYIIFETHISLTIPSLSKFSPRKFLVSWKTSLPHIDSGIYKQMESQWKKERNVQKCIKQHRSISTGNTLISIIQNASHYCGQLMHKVCEHAIKYAKNLELLGTWALC